MSSLTLGQDEGTVESAHWESFRPAQRGVERAQPTGCCPAHRVLPNLEAADEAMPSQQLKNNGPQSVVICCPVQGKDIKAPEVQVLQKNNILGRKAPSRAPLPQGD